MKSKILLVGGEGYLGNSLKSYLNDFEVYSTSTSEKNVNNHFVIRFEDEDSYSCLKGKKFDIIFVLASSIQSIGIINLNHQDLLINTVYYAKFLEFLKENSTTQKIVYVSSMTVYNENSKVPIDENEKRIPPNTYGLSKSIAEDITNFFCFRNDINGLILRIPGIYGGNRESGFIYNLIKKVKQNEKIIINTKGLIYWETIHIDDLCEIISDLLSEYKWQENINVFNLSYGEETDLYKTVNHIFKVLGKEPIFEKENEKGYCQFYLSNKKIKSLVSIKSNYYESLTGYIKLHA